VADAVVDADDGLAPQLRDGPRHDGEDVKRRAHPWPLGVGDGIDVFVGQASLVQRLLQDFKDL